MSVGGPRGVGPRAAARPLRPARALRGARRQRRRRNPPGRARSRARRAAACGARHPDEGRRAGRGVSRRHACGCCPPEGDQPAAVAVMLEHRDSGLSVPLFIATDGDDVVAEWKSWGRVLGLPLLVVDDRRRAARTVPAHRPASASAHPRRARRRRGAITWRRPSIPDAAQARPAAGRAVGASRRARDHRAQLALTRQLAAISRRRGSAPRTGSARHRGST